MRRSWFGSRSAVGSGDLVAVLRELRADWVWVPVLRAEAEALARGDHAELNVLATAKEHCRGLVYDVFRRHQIPQPTPEHVLHPMGIDALIARLSEGDELRLDPDGPAPRMATTRHWRAAQRALGAAPDTPEQRLVEALTAPQPEQLRHALACGAHRQVLAAQPWNAFGPQGSDLITQRGVLAHNWDVHTPEDWVATMHQLTGQHASQGDYVFAVRRELRTGTHPAELDAWQAALSVTAASHGLSRDRTTALLGEVRRVHAYEGFLRERGLLGPTAQVRSLFAWDWARGVNMARDGLAADLCDEPTAAHWAQHCATLARRHYACWDEFGVAFTLGRLLWSYDRYDELLDWGSSVELDTTLRLHRLLRDDPRSPWHHIPFTT